MTDPMTDTTDIGRVRLNQEYYDIAVKRVKDATAQMRLEL